MSNTVILLVGQVVLAIVILPLIAVITWLFFHRSSSRTQTPVAQLRDVSSRTVVSADEAATQQEWPSLARKMAAAWLVVAEGSGIGAYHAVGEATTVIGRSSSCDIKLTDSAISRRHASIVKQGDRFSLYDVGSTFGTEIDGKRVDLGEGVPLKHGSVICLGQTRLVFKHR